MLGIAHRGSAYQAIGKIQEFIKCEEHALVIAQEIGDRKSEGFVLGNLGSAYYALGNSRKAIEFYNQAIAIAREIGDRKDEGYALQGLGNPALL